MTTEAIEIIERVESLPIDMKLEIIDRLLESISPSRTEIDDSWSAEVERRIDDVESGKVKLTPLEEVRERFRKRYRK